MKVISKPNLLRVAALAEGLTVLRTDCTGLFGLKPGVGGPPSMTFDFLMQLKRPDSTPEFWIYTIRSRGPAYDKSDFFPGYQTADRARYVKRSLDSALLQTAFSPPLPTPLLFSEDADAV